MTYDHVQLAHVSTDACIDSQPTDRSDKPAMTECWPTRGGDGQIKVLTYDISRFVFKCNTQVHIRTAVVFSEHGHRAEVVSQPIRATHWVECFRKCFNRSDPQRPQSLSLELANNNGFTQRNGIEQTDNEHCRRSYISSILWSISDQILSSSNTSECCHCIVGLSTTIVVTAHIQIPIDYCCLVKGILSIQDNTHLVRIRIPDPDIHHNPDLAQKLIGSCKTKSWRSNISLFQISSTSNRISYQLTESMHYPLMLSG